VHNDIRAVIVDFAGVLSSPLAECYAAFQTHLEVTNADLRAAVARDEQVSGRNALFELERGRISEAEYVRRVAAQLAFVNLDRMPQIFCEYQRPNRPMIDFVGRVRAQGFPTALLSNAAREWEVHWRTLVPNLDELFDHVVFSWRTGFRKPEREIYELTLDRLGNGMLPEECLFIDDRDANCAVAKELGMRVVLFEDTQQGIAETEAVLGIAEHPEAPDTPVDERIGAPGALR
jgi:putative hydrolase of the HAD superfamily